MKPAQRPDTVRAKITIRGAVQGVGFRPHVFRLAIGLGLDGCVLNSPNGVFIEVEGEKRKVDEFRLRLEEEKPPRAIIQSLESSYLDPAGYDGFEIRPSDDRGEISALILPDIAPCPDCLRELFDPCDRRHRYPFINCTNCGPRFSIIEALPYDRPHTSMRKFAMCPDCEREYHDPLDRRFHAQPVACPRCGPQLELWDSRGHRLTDGDEALCEAAGRLRSGAIIALKGVGGFQLLVDARNDEAVGRLRQRKHREEKPFALMCPSLEAARQSCRLSAAEERLLCSAESPIVLLQRRPEAAGIAPSAAPGNPTLGIMLPSSPLHHLLCRELGFPIVATSGNLSDEPICTDENEALERLGGIADFFLVHNRPIVRHVDDSIVRIVRGREMMLRRARGYAPLPITFESNKRKAATILALGAHLKNSVALSVRSDVFISQHIGDLETSQAHAAFRAVAADLPRLYQAAPEVVACDMHPDYLSTKHAHQTGVPVHPVQHHWAHVLSCMADNGLTGPVLGVSWDGTGYGPDGTIWGGEFLVPGGDSFQRVAHLRPFRLPGGAAAIREPRRIALGVLFEILGVEVMNRHDLALVRQLTRSTSQLLRQMLEKGVHSPVTTSAGRLFDAVSSLLDLCHQTTFEGQAAMKLEFVVQPGVEGAYPFELRETGVIDWQPVLEGILADLTSGISRGVIAAKFHHALAEMIVAVSRRIGEEKVVLTGGCFQNVYLLERSIDRLSAEGFRPYWHQRIPPNDGGISVGQVMSALGTFERPGTPAAAPAFASVS